MKLYSENENYKLYQGNMLDMLEVIPANSIDSIVTDPPYELNFMGKGWDNAGVSFQPETWKKCFEALKPGGYLLAFGGSRTFHRIACAIEDAGFEIRDTIMWIYGSGFPKSMALDKAIESKLTRGSANKKDFKTLEGTKVETGNWGIGKMTLEQGFRDTDYTADKHLRVDKVDYKTEEGKQWQGWGTCLKPSFEPIIIARKPFKGSLVDNVLKYGVGGLNIDECRVGLNGEKPPQESGNKPKDTALASMYKNGNGKNGLPNITPINGRFPANTILTYDQITFDEVCGGFPNTKGFYRPNCKDKSYNQSSNIQFGGGNVSSQYNDSGSASRYFYCAKASRKDRDEGCNDLEDTYNACSNQAIAEAKRGNNDFADENNSTFNKVYKGKNTHPTVKPTELMQYLIRLVSPKGATILDCFNGSGSTGKAVMYENKEQNKNYRYIGIELNEEYLKISRARIEDAQKEE